MICNIKKYLYIVEGGRCRCWQVHEHTNSKGCLVVIKFVLQNWNLIHFYTAIDRTNIGAPWDRNQEAVRQGQQLQEMYLPFKHFWISLTTMTYNQYY